MENFMSNAYHAHGNRKGLTFRTELLLGTMTLILLLSSIITIFELW